MTAETEPTGDGDLSEQVKADISHAEKPLDQGRLELDPHIDRRLDHKFDLHIVPWLFGIWLLSFIDRSNIGNAKIAGLTDDLGMTTGTIFNVALLVFYVPYILVDVPSNWMLKRIRAGIYLPPLITSWGLVCTFIGFAKSSTGLVVCRVLLGAFEGGILGGVIIYLAIFFPRPQMMTRCGYFTARRHSRARLVGFWLQGWGRFIMAVIKALSLYILANLQKR